MRPWGTRWGCRALTSALLLVTAGCFDHAVGPPEDDAGQAGGDGAESGTTESGTTDPAAAIDTIPYRDNLQSHPGCSTAGLSYTPMTIPGYSCAAKGYALPAGVTERTDAPIVVLVHGNSDAPDSWERFPADSGEPMLAERLVAAGITVIAVDFRIDRVDDPQGNNDTENAARNINHGWAVPILEHLLEAVMANWPDRQVSLAGFSLGATVIRDALRRMHVRGLQPFERVDHVVLLAGANHGVSTYARLCGRNPTMRGQVACEMGNRDSFSPTDFIKPLNGTGGKWETPCSSGQSAYGDSAACGGNTVHWTTVVMQDIADGSYQDEFVSEASAALSGATNELIGLSDVDESGYFFNGLLRNHYGSARSNAAVTLAVSALSGGQ